MFWSVFGLFVHEWWFLPLFLSLGFSFVFPSVFSFGGVDNFTSMKFESLAARLTVQLHCSLFLQRKIFNIDPQYCSGLEA